MKSFKSFGQDSQTFQYKEILTERNNIACPESTKHAGNF
jgi:hypothetical protein